VDDNFEELRDNWMLLALDDRPPYFSVLDVVPPFEGGAAGSIIRERRCMNIVFAGRDYEENGGDV